MAELLPTSTGRAQLDALRTYEEHAAKGDAHGAFNCSVCYARGLGCARDRDRALRFLRQAADGGLPQAQAQLAYLYSTGRGGIDGKDDAEAERWWRLAAALLRATSRTRSSRSPYHQSPSTRFDPLSFE